MGVPGGRKGPAGEGRDPKERVPVWLVPGRVDQGTRALAVAKAPAASQPRETSRPSNARDELRFRFQPKEQKGTE